MESILQKFFPRDLASGFTKVWNHMRWGLLTFERRRDRKLRLCESLALGERRSLSVVEFGSRKLLLGSTGYALTVLATFEEMDTKADVPTWQFINGNLVRCA